MASIPRARTATALLIGLAAAGAAEMILPVPFFRADAFVAVDEPAPLLRLASARNAATLAVSKPVVQRLAMSLDGTPTSVPATDLSVSAGDGFVDVQARAPDAERAARLATTLAQTLVAETASLAAETARHRDAAAAAALEASKAAARRARERLGALGLPDSDPADAIAHAAVAVRGAETQVAAVRAIIAAGTPPLGAGSDLPANIAALQQTYWELRKQYEKATETLGDRHTTVIALHDGVERASANLVAEWGRLERGGINELGVLRAREALLRKAANAEDPAKRAAYEAVRAADAGVARASAAMAAPSPDVTLRLVSPAAVPAEAAGLGALTRALLVAGSGAAAFLLACFAYRRRARASSGPVDRGIEPDGDARCGPAMAARREDAVPLVRTTDDGTLDGFDWDEDLVTPAPTAVDRDGDAARGRIEPSLGAILAAEPGEWDQAEMLSGPITIAPDVEAAAPVAPIATADDGPYPTAFQPEFVERSVGESIEIEPLDGQEAVPIDREADRDLRDAMRAIVADLPRKGEGKTAPVIVVAALSQDRDTAAVALALGEAAADQGLRVLVVESDRPHPALAAEVALEAAPVLVDLSGTLRVALPAARIDGVFIAPILRGGPRIAAALARNGDVDLIEDPGRAFDAVIIDGGRAADCAREGFDGDLYLRVGPLASPRDDAFCLDLFDAEPNSLLGTVAAGRFVPREDTAAPTVVSHQGPRPIGRVRDGRATMRAAPRPASLRISQRRRVSGR